MHQPENDTAPDRAVCVRCLVGGRVQGVYFRASARDQAQRLGVSGYARNLPEWGQVENNLQTSLQTLWEDVAMLGIGETIDEATVQQRLDDAAATVNSLLAQ